MAQDRLLALHVCCEVSKRITHNVLKFVSKPVLEWHAAKAEIGYSQTIEFLQILHVVSIKTRLNRYHRKVF